MNTGKINVQTENIFPIIKKFLYSDHEIFLREIVSNAVDATSKLKLLTSSGEFKDEIGDVNIEVFIDKDKKTLTVRDKGVGMTAEEIDKYINQIAFSGAEEFLKKYKGKSEEDTKALIGHFGLGFYSSFMVSNKVEIISKTWKKGKGSKAVKWECDGSPEYKIEEIDKKERGTDIVLHITEDSQEYLEESRILQLLNKYCKFLPIPIIFGTEKTTKEIEGEKDEKGNPKTEIIETPRFINNTKPAWTIKPTELKEDDYKKFYHELYPFTFEEPIFNIHLNVDYPFNLTGILYFPKLKQYIDVQREKIQLYCNQVFVTDSVEGIVPDFLTLLHGVLDSPDIPLNVSRSYLQSDPNVKKISGHIAKKVADKLEDMFKNSREDFEQKWNDIKVFIQYGMMSDDKFYDRAKTFCLLKNIDGKFFTFDEYKTHIEKNQTDKDGQLIYLYASDAVEQHSFINAAKERAYDILLLDGPIDNHFINQLERKFEKASFSRVDADIIDKLIKKEDTLPSKLSEENQNKLKELLEKLMNKEKYYVSFEPMSNKDVPFTITLPEYPRRMKDMSATGRGMDFMGGFPMQYNLVVNSNHPVLDKILELKDEAKQTELIKQLTDLARLSQNLLKGEELTSFVKRSVDLVCE